MPHVSLLRPGFLGDPLHPSNKFFTQISKQNPLSSPSALQNPPNPHPTNHFHQKNTWHSSYAPLGRINIWIEFMQPRPGAPFMRVFCA
jgi:hypothetical protein